MFEFLTSCFVFVNLIVNSGTYQCLSTQIVPDQSECSGTYECADGTDETTCPQNSLFKNLCENQEGAQSYFTDDQRCDGVSNCNNLFDELDCPEGINQLYFRCIGDESNWRPLPFLCDGRQLCTDETEEKETGFGFKCNGIHIDLIFREVDSFPQQVPYRCIVPQQSLLPISNGFKERYSVCFNNEDDCYTFNEDGKPILNISKCWPCLDGTIIQREQVCDTVFDCADLSDECLCERQFTSEICDHLLRDNNCSSNEVPCVFGNKCIDVHQLCDGSEDCPNGTDELRCKNTPDCPISTVECDRIRGRNAAKCDGRVECANLADECEVGCPYESPYCDHFNRRPSAIFNTSCEFIGPFHTCDKIMDCADGIDERFCPHLKQCDENDPLSSVYHDACTGERCNLVADCDNIVDELNCSSLTHFYCDNNKKFLPTSKVFNGIFDCDDYTDECLITSSSISSQTDLIANNFLRVALWIIMILAVVGNLIVIIKTSTDIVHINRNANASSSSIGLCFSIMLLNLAVSDFLMGFYLLFIASKSIKFSGTYCQQKQTWLLSNQCVFAGVIAVVSSQMSVFMLVVMASCRLYVVLKPFKAQYMSWRRLCSIIACLWVISVLLAVIPTFPSISKILATEIIVDQPYIPQSVSTRQLINLVETVNKLPGERQTIPEVASLSVSSFCTIFNKSLVVPYYCEESFKTSFGSLGYYSTDGVCLPRYYGGSNEKAFIYSFAIVLMDYTAFLYMFIAYMVLFYFASYKKKQGISGDNSSVSEVESKRNQALSGTIMRIIITDFLCWIPICIMSFLSFGGVEIPGMAYPITAIVLIPINSAVNPWIYSSFLVRKIKKILPRIVHRAERQSSQTAKQSTSDDRNTRNGTKVTEL